MKIGILQGIKIEWGTVISKVKSVNDSPAYLPVGVPGNVGYPTHEHNVVLIIASTQAGLDVV